MSEMLNRSSEDPVVIESAMEELNPPVQEKQTALGRVLHYVRELGHFVRLLFGLLFDERVDKKVKLFVGAVLTYVFAPFDFMPEMFSGLFGMLDDFVLSAFAIHVILNWVDPEVVRAHWRGDKELLPTIQKGIANAEVLVPDAILKKIQLWIGRHTEKSLVKAPAVPAEESERKRSARRKKSTED